MASTSKKTLVTRLPLPQKRAAMASFSRRLYEEMQARGWTQAELARRAFGTTTNSEGHSVAKGRDRVSVYLAGKSQPDPRNLGLLCKALDLQPEQLAPELVAETVDRAEHEIQMFQSGDQCHLIINKLVPMSVASQVIAILTAAAGTTEAVPPAAQQRGSRCRKRAQRTNGQTSKRSPKPSGSRMRR